MPSLTFNHNIPAIREWLKNAGAQFLQEIQTNLERQELFFITYIQLQKMSFPKTGPPVSNGTRVISGKLRRDWFNMAVVNNQSVTARIWSTTPYAPIMELGGDVPRNSAWGKPTRPYVVHYPARLGIGKAWHSNFMPIFKKVILDAWKKVVKRE